MKRRNFLKYSGLLAAGTAFGSCAQKAKVVAGALGKHSANLIRNGKVLTAAHWGPLQLTLKNGKIVSSEGALQRSVENPLQSVVQDQVYAESRVKYPMVRKSFLENPEDNKPHLRGKDKWVRVSYEKAIQLTADRLKKVRREKGPSGIFAGSYGWKSTAQMHNSVILLQRFMGMSGGFVGGTGDYSTGASQVIMPHVLGTLEVYEQQTVWPVVLENTELVVIWGANPMVTLKIAWSSSDGTGLDYFEKLKKSGKKIICIDPVKSETCEFLNARWIPVNPNTDVALMFGIAHAMRKSGKYDKEFLEEYTEGFDKFEEYLLGKTDGVAKTPSWASKITGVSAETIEELAKLFFENRTMLMSGWSMQRQHHGEQAHWALVTLASMIGQIGLPGGGFGLSYHYSNGGNPTTKAAVVGGMSMGKVDDEDAAEWLQKSSEFTIPVARIADALLHPGKKIDNNGSKITYPDIDFIYWAGGNPFVHQQETNKLLDAWHKPSTVVVNDHSWTPTARHADIVFPITTTYERNDLSMTGDYSNMHIVPMKQAVEKQGESRDDYQVFSDLAREFGVLEQYTEGKSEMDWIRDFYAKAEKHANAQKLSIPSFDEFWEKGELIEFKAGEDAKKWVRYADFREDPLLNPIGTPSGKIEIYSKTIEKMGYKDCPAHPTWFEPFEWVGMKNKPAEFALVTAHPPYRLHSQLANTSLREKYAISDREPIWIHEQDAKRMGISAGDVVRVYNKRGAILGGALITDKINPGSVRMCEGAWYDPKNSGSDPDLCVNGSINVLTRDIPTSSLSNGNIGHTTLVNIEKYDKKAPAVQVFKEPALS